MAMVKTGKIEHRYKQLCVKLGAFPTVKMGTLVLYRHGALMDSVFTE